MPSHLRPLRRLLLTLAPLVTAGMDAAAHEPPAVPIADLTRRIAAHPDSLPLYLMRGELRRVTGDFAGARGDYAQVERLDPAHPELSLCRAALALDTAAPADALAHLDAALRVRPSDPEALRLRARAHAALGRRRAAIADLDAAIGRLEHPSPDLFLERARLLIDEGDARRALAGLDEARRRIGATASLELLAIELELADGRPHAARARFGSLAARYADPSALAGLGARIAAADGGGDPLAQTHVAPPTRTDAGAAARAPDATTTASTAIPRGAVWKYEATGTNLGTTWRQTSYNDSAWASGSGVFGYGEPYVATTVPFGLDPLNRYPTTYFRTTFTMPDPLPPIASLTMTANYDDGFVVYLNGVEVARRSLPSGSIGYATLAQGHEAGDYESINLSGGLFWLMPGTNVLAVEVHQVSASSADLVWDADLSHSGLPPLTRGPYLQMATDDAISVRWRTGAATDSRVVYGTSPGTLNGSVTDDTLTTEHELRITGLQPATRYYYAVGTIAELIAGDASYSFVTAPQDSSAAPVRIWVVGDSGLPGPVAYAVRDAYLEWTGTVVTDLWLMLGDNAYGSGTDSEYQAAVFNQYPAMLRRCALWPTRGNHDELHAGVNNDYYDLFTMPTAGQAGGLPSGSEAYYSFNWSDIHFVCLDSEGSNRAPGGAMLTWLANDLAANTRPWVIAYWHHPPYSKGSHNSDSESQLEQMRQNALPILEAGGVDLVLSGHSHSYERSFLIDGHYGTSVTLTPDMIVNGGDGRAGGDGAYVKPATSPWPNGGAVYAVAGSSAQTSGGPLNHPVMVASLNLAGSMVLDIHRTGLNARFLTQAGAVMDSFTIIKTGVVGAGGAETGGLRLGPALPNPFRGDLRMGYVLERPGRVRVSVIDPSGRRVAVIEEGWRAAGAHEARWDGRDAAGQQVANGVYLAVLETDGRRVSRKIAHVR